MTESELNAGDMLSLPRGILHSTSTAESFSAHVTIGLTVYTWANLIKELLSSAIDVDNHDDGARSVLRREQELQSARIIQKKFKSMA